jgi:hypothetical protein
MPLVFAQDYIIIYYYIGVLYIGQHCREVFTSDKQRAFRLMLSMYRLCVSSKYVSTGLALLLPDWSGLPRPVYFDPWVLFRLSVRLNSQIRRTPIKLKYMPVCRRVIHDQNSLYNVKTSEILFT